MTSPPDHPHTILVPIDFSEASVKAAETAAAIAHRTQGSVHFLHAYSIPIEGPPGVVAPPSSAYLNELVTESKTQLEAMAKKFFLNGNAKVLVRSGDPRNVIKAVAREIGADLIVMGTHGRRGLERFFLGSVAEEVVRGAPCSVLVAR